MASDEVIKLKEDGNQHFKSNNYESALTCYTQALKLCNHGTKEKAVENLVATLYSNRSAVHLKRADYSSAERDASKGK